MLQTSVFPNYTNTPNKATEEQNRTLCLYRVSSAGQLYHTEENEADIPMQRLECRRFAERMGWNIVYEFQEEGVSGHKVRAENRDKIQKVKELAKQKKFDIFLVFMFDRIGRKRADGTDVIRMRYVCQTKTRSHENCNGQTGYTVHILDAKTASRRSCAQQKRPLPRFQHPPDSCTASAAGSAFGKAALFHPVSYC